MTVGWAQRLRERPVLVAAGAGVLIGLAGRNLPLSAALFFAGNHEFSCHSENPLDCTFPDAFEAGFGLLEILFLVAVITLALVVFGAIILAVTGVRLSMFRRAGVPATRADRIFFGAGFAALIPAAWTVWMFLTNRA